MSRSRPNIILILTDDQGYGDLGRHGNPVLETPNMDRLFEESVRFEDFCVSPSCSPSRCALMTGMHEFKSGVSHTIHGRNRSPTSLAATRQKQNSDAASGILKSKRRTRLLSRPTCGDLAERAGPCLPETVAAPNSRGLPRIVGL